MPTVVSISSWTAASRVGLAAQFPAFNREDVTPICVPTTLLGVRPGLDMPTGGAAISDAMFGCVLATAMNAPAAEHASWALTGYFATPGQVELTAEHLKAWRGTSPHRKIAVDPVIGDSPMGQYVPDAVAHAIRDTLAPLADVLLPNTWEAGYLTSSTTPPSMPAPQTASQTAPPMPSPTARPNSVQDSVQTAGQLHCPMVVTSVEHNDRIGAVYVEAGNAWFAHTPNLGARIHGAGDHFSAAFVAALARKKSAKQALCGAVSATHHAIDRAIFEAEPDIHPLPDPMNDADVVMDAIPDMTL